MGPINLWFWHPPKKKQILSRKRVLRPIFRHKRCARLGCRWLKRTPKNEKIADTEGCAKSRIGLRRNKTPYPIGTKFCMVVSIPDIITCANFVDGRLRSFCVAVGQISLFSIGFRRRSYNTLALACECVIGDKMWHSSSYWPSCSMRRRDASINCPWVSTARRRDPNRPSSVGSWLGYLRWCECMCRRRSVSRCFVVLRQLRSIRRSVPTTAFKTAIVSLVRSRLDYRNAVLVSLPAYPYDKIWDAILACAQKLLNLNLPHGLQSVMNLAARLIYSLRHSDHISDALISLHWLRVQERVRFKMAVLM